MVPGDAWRPSSSGTDPVNSLTDKSKDKNLTEKQKQTNTSRKPKPKSPLLPTASPVQGTGFFLTQKEKRRNVFYVAKHYREGQGAGIFEARLKSLTDTQSCLTPTNSALPVQQPPLRSGERRTIPGCLLPGARRDKPLFPVPIPTGPRVLNPLT